MSGYTSSTDRITSTLNCATKGNQHSQMSEVGMAQNSLAMSVAVKIMEEQSGQFGNRVAPFSDPIHVPQFRCMLIWCPLDYSWTTCYYGRAYKSSVDYDFL